MEDEHVLPGLLRKRAEVAGRLAAARAEAERLAKALESLETTIRLFSPDAASRTPAAPTPAATPPTVPAPPARPAPPRRRRPLRQARDGPDGEPLRDGGRRPEQRHFEHRPAALRHVRAPDQASVAAVGSAPTNLPINIVSGL